MTTDRITVTVTLEEARAALTILERQTESDELPVLVRKALGFSAELYKAIKTAEGERYAKR